MLNLFPEHKFSSSDTLHFGPDQFDPSKWDRERMASMDRFLHNGNSCTPSRIDTESDEYFYLPLMKIDFGGDTAYIVAEGDTNDIWIYEGKHTWIYMLNEPETRIEQRYELAMGIAGEGPWYANNSWILDLNNDGKPDILTRKVGEWITIDDNGDIADHAMDELSAVTWNGTNFVSLQLRNPDSLKAIYHVYFNSY